jgi:cobalt/nickel transport system permease protein
MLEQWAYSNRWRWVHPGAKGLLTLCAFISAFVCTDPWFLVAVAVALAVLTVWGAGIPLGQYLRVFLPPLAFLAIGGGTLAISLHWPDATHAFALRLDPTQLPRVAILVGRALSCLAALLLLSLTTPMTDIIFLLHRLKVPAEILDLMTVGYRSLFVFLEAIHDITTAQAARLGYATTRTAIRSLGSLIAVLAVQVWQRSHALDQAALARANDGPLFFLENEYADSRRSFIMAAGAGLILMVSAAALRLIGR